MNPFRKIVAGDPYRKTRLHDEKGNRVSAVELARLPRHARMFVARRVLKRHPRLPWWTLAVVERVDELLQPGWAAVEFGSGMSTQWLAERVATLLSVEHDPTWFAHVGKTLPANVRYELRPSQTYADLSDLTDGSIDFVVVDGLVRSACVESAIPKLRRGGYLYLDNSDKDATGGDMRRAEQFVTDAAADRDGRLSYFTGFTIGMLNTHQGLLAQL
jgi:hypothetical protein